MGRWRFQEGAGGQFEGAGEGFNSGSRKFEEAGKGFKWGGGQLERAGGGFDRSGWEFEGAGGELYRGVDLAVGEVHVESPMPLAWAAGTFERGCRQFKDDTSGLMAPRLWAVASRRGGV